MVLLGHEIFTTYLMLSILGYKEAVFSIKYLGNPSKPERLHMRYCTPLFDRHLEET